MKRKNILVKFVSAVTAVVFLTTGIAWSAPVSSISADEKNSREASLAPDSIFPDLDREEGMGIYNLFTARKGLFSIIVVLLLPTLFRYLAVLSDQFGWFYPYLLGVPLSAVFVNFFWSQRGSIGGMFIRLAGRFADMKNVVSKTPSYDLRPELSRLSYSAGRSILEKVIPSIRGPWLTAARREGGVGAVPYYLSTFLLLAVFILVNPFEARTESPKDFQIAALKKAVNVPAMAVEKPEAAADQIDKETLEKTTMATEAFIKHPFSALFAPVVKPVSGKLTSSYGMRRDPVYKDRMEFHPGIDIGTDEWTDIKSMYDGKVVFAGNSGDGYGNKVVIETEEMPGVKISVLYGHMVAPYAKAGDIVKKGKTIGGIGETGKSTGEHLHILIEVNGKMVNPALFIPADILKSWGAKTGQREGLENKLAEMEKLWEGEMTLEKEDRILALSGEILKTAGLDEDSKNVSNALKSFKKAVESVKKGKLPNDAINDFLKNLGQLWAAAFLAGFGAAARAAGSRGNLILMSPLLPAAKPVDHESHPHSSRITGQSI